MTSQSVTRLILYAKDVDGMVRFYETHFATRCVNLKGTGSSNWCRWGCTAPNAAPGQ